MVKPPPTLSDQLRQAILNSGESRYQIANATGLGEAALSRFVHGERGLSLESVDRIATYLHLRIVMDKPRKGIGDR